MKLLGALFLMCGTIVLCRSWIFHRRQELRMIRETSVALEHMAASIRLKKEPLLQAVRQQQERPLCGNMFGQLYQEVKGGMPLQRCWNNTFSVVEPSELAEILHGMDVTGDEQQITGALSLAAQQLRQAAEEKYAHQQQNERLCLTLGLCAAGIVVVVLI